MTARVPTVKKLFYRGRAGKESLNRKLPGGVAGNMLVNACVTQTPPLQFFPLRRGRSIGDPTGSAIHSAETGSPKIFENLHCKQTDMTTGLAEAD